MTQNCSTGPKLADKKQQKNNMPLLDSFKNLLLPAKDINNKVGEQVKSMDDIKNRLLLKIERAEIMAAMIAMRNGKD